MCYLLLERMLFSWLMVCTEPVVLVLEDSMNPMNDAFVLLRAERKDESFSLDLLGSSRNRKNEARNERAVYMLSAFGTCSSSGI